MIYVEKGKVYLGTAAPSSGGGGQTINNQDITITANGEYTAAEGYTGIGTATVNCPEPDIVSATNTTGSAIALGDKVWLEKVTGGWNIIPSIKNYNVDGTLTETNKVVSGFTTSNYISLLSQFRPSTSPWEIVFKFKGSGVLIAKSTSASWNGLVMSTYGTGGVMYYVVAQNASNALFIKEGTNPIDFDNFNWVKFCFTGTEYIGYYSTDGVNWQEDMRYTSSTAIYDYSATTYIGCRVSGSFGAFNGEIDLSETYIKIGGNMWWTPYVVYDYKTNFSGIAEEAIAVSGTGDVKTALGGYVTVEVTADADDAEIMMV